MEKRGMILKVRLPMKMLKRERWYVASCPSLDVVSQGDTIKKAKENLSEAVSLFLISCLERGTLEQVLKAGGFRPTGRKRQVGIGHKGQYINVPIELLSDKGSAATCHA